MGHLDRVSRNCLRGYPPPQDLLRIWQANDHQPWNDLVPFTLIEKLDDDFFAGYRMDDGISPEIATAYQKMFDHIAFVGRREDGELVGYWLGPENRAPSDSPIVELDTEGQFHLQGHNLAEYLLGCICSEDEFGQLHRILVDLGCTVTANTRSELFEFFDTLQSEFGNPNRISWRYQKAMGAPPPSRLRFGNYAFPDAVRILSELGIENITADSTRKQVIEHLGSPDVSGGDTKVPVLGYIDPWIKYKRSDCDLLFAFEKDGAIKTVTLLEDDWDPGM